MCLQIWAGKRGVSCGYIYMFYFRFGNITDVFVYAQTLETNGLSSEILTESLNLADMTEK